MKPKSDIRRFLEPLAGEIQGFLLDYHYHAIAELWESYDHAILELKEIGPVLDLMRQHDTTWHDKGESYWLAGLVEEIGEFASFMIGKHDDAITWEMMQIASIALNWLRLYRTPGTQQSLLERKNADGP